MQKVIAQRKLERNDFYVRLPGFLNELGAEFICSYDLHPTEHFDCATVSFYNVRGVTLVESITHKLSGSYICITLCGKSNILHGLEAKIKEGEKSAAVLQEQKKIAGQVL